MDDSNITMEKYIRLEEEKARNHRKVFNWESTKYGKIWYDEYIHNLRSVETEFLAIAFNNKPDDLKSKKDNDDNEIDIIQSSKGNEMKHGSNVFSKTSHDKIIKTFRTGSFVINLKVNIVIWIYYANGILFFLIMNLYVSFGIPFDPKRYYKDGDCVLMLRRPRTEGLKFYNLCPTLVNFADMSPLPPREVREDLQSGDTQGLGCGFYVDVRAYEGWEEMESLGFVRYWSESERMIPKNGDLHDHWRSISTDGDLLGPLPSYTLIRDLVLRLCHQIMAHSIVGRSQAPEKSKAHISGGQFVAQLDKHFRPLTADILRGLMVIDPELPIIDMGELMRLQICVEIDDTWA
nr:hypothetical protein [Tanacetum cinerariifolium]